MTQDEEFIPNIVTMSIVGDLNGLSAPNADDLFSKVISDIAKGCVANGAAMIGHIKANFTTSDSGMLSISCTTDDGNVRARSKFTGPVKEYSSTMNVIVYGICHDSMCAVIDQALISIPGSKAVKRIENSGCDDPECHDPACSNPDHRQFIQFD